MTPAGRYATTGLVGVCAPSTPVLYTVQGSGLREHICCINNMVPVSDAKPIVTLLIGRVQNVFQTAGLTPLLEVA